MVALPPRRGLGTVLALSSSPSPSPFLLNKALTLTDRTDQSLFCNCNEGGTWEGRGQRMGCMHRRACTGELEHRICFDLGIRWGENVRKSCLVLPQVVIPFKVLSSYVSRENHSTNNPLVKSKLEEILTHLI